MSEIPRISIVDARTVFVGKVFSVEQARVRLPSGHEISRDTVVHPGAVVILPKADDGSLILVRQYRHAVRGSILEFPAGTLEPGEEPQQCAEREICEEVGFAAAKWQELGELFPAPGLCNEKQYLYLASELTSKKLPADEDEIIEVVRLSVTELEQAIACGQMQDGKSIAIYTRAKLCGLLD